MAFTYPSSQEWPRSVKHHNQHHVLLATGPEVVKTPRRPICSTAPRLTSGTDQSTANQIVAVPAHQSTFEKCLERYTKGQRAAQLESLTLE